MPNNLMDVSADVNPSSKVRVYIDGFNLYHAIEALGEPTLKWLNYWTLSQGFIRDGEELGQVHFFTAQLKWNAEKQSRHANYIAALKASQVTVHEANFLKSKKYCKKFDRYCEFYEEKQTDVAIAVKAVSDALSGSVGRLILLTADSDQIPTAKLLSGIVGIKVSLIFPPGRKQQARELGSIIKDRKELAPGRMRACLLPRTVHRLDGKAVAYMPAIYLVNPHHK